MESSTIKQQKKLRELKKYHQGKIDYIFIDQLIDNSYLRKYVHSELVKHFKNENSITPIG